MVDWRPTAGLDTLAARARLLAAIRTFFFGRGVQEVDTPLLSRTAPSERQLACFEVVDGGYLVPSPEHALKRLVAAGSGPVYQLGHVFRAAEVGRWHNPEFTMLEWYRPGWAMSELVDEVNALLAQVAEVAVVRRIEFGPLFFEYTALDPHTACADALAEYACQAGLAPDSSRATPQRLSPAFWLDLIMSVQIAPTLGFGEPLCVEGFPAGDAVLVALRDSRPPVAERFEIYWQGVELANGAQELTDARLARSRMQREQAARAAAGLPVPPMDESLLAAMTGGLPECAGVALGVDRLLALRHGAEQLSDVLPFAWGRR